MISYLNLNAPNSEEQTCWKVFGCLKIVEINIYLCYAVMTAANGEIAGRERGHIMCLRWMCT